MIKQRKLLGTLLASSIIISSFTANAEENVSTYQFVDNTNKMISIEDGKTDLKLSFFENTPENVVTEIKAVTNKNDPLLSTSINTFLIQASDKVILIDAGAGSCMADNAGKTVKTLSDLGITPESVTDVLLTHAHPDHICGLMKVDAENNFTIPTYPNAVIHISEEEYQYWTQKDNGESAKSILDAYNKTNPNLIARFKAGDTILEQFKTIAAYGHTVGHIAYLWTPSAGNEWLFWGDVMHNNAMQFAYPNITLKFDSNADLAKQTRLKIMEDAALNKWSVAGSHLPYPGVGKITKEADNSFKWNVLN
ncbi:MBL fold metallo-hydrolase [Thorsellia anophelis]|uniref:Glyoxylase, beta-lactamase superfamily II n=1 Tax=Thorsellia anophelis DSM 18579 TaxID=1123402 RepID=A0A1I0DXN6_9GAMM|nr:MBL fold metallo-hydrolase [Thorsellia anophelis]SET36793.1 Glyoxylase, beta-lactamase superfamily II [Thorsellia anophelis DSM 18579]